MDLPQWKSRTKRELMIEVWEALDCESVGAAELKAIERAVRERFGDGAVESHASVARLLADEGAELRHPEVLESFVAQRLFDPYAEMFRDVLGIADLDQAAESIIKLEELRKMFASDGDQKGLHRVREMGLKGKRHAYETAGDLSVAEEKRAEQSEIAEWFLVWLQQPEIFDTWIELRRKSADFCARFSKSEKE